MSGRARQARRGVLVVKTIDLSIDMMLRGQLRYLHEHGISPLAIAAADTGRLQSVAAREGIRSFALPFRRKPSPLSDLIGFVRLLALLAALRPAVVVYGTPKASLLTALAGVMTKTPVRIHLLRGMRLDTATGLLRRVLLVTEALTLRLSTRTIAVGHSLVRRCRELGLDTTHMTVVGSGSVGGVDLARFGPADPATRRACREHHKLGPETVVVGFVGRLTADKGVDALLGAVKRLRDGGRDVVVALVGPDDGVAGLTPATRADLGEGWVLRLGELDDPSEAFTLFDIFCLPSRREGLPTVVLEAWAAEVPVVTSDVAAFDALIDDGVTGVRARVDDEADLARALEAARRDRDALVSAARDHVRREFDHRVVWENHRREYAAALREATGAPVA
ncbi:glycosyltransferase [Frondihabitans australicus]|uniref:D-inositol 3-phosphate glycosyltransferase n=1 Tax=Frondihabitans australicus TaxID=386892 RepID=A0A495IJG2_9MICO|nr:glycosyltransferase [Frondihabitans australicus]RKR76124.1 glycosyltransferase involved in cell wall biosynthesis [Frondihabitans australicus]